MPCSIPTRSHSLDEVSPSQVVAQPARSEKVTKSLMVFRSPGMQSSGLDIGLQVGFVRGPRDLRSAEPFTVSTSILTTTLSVSAAHGFHCRIRIASER